MPLGRKVGLGPGEVVLYGDPAPSLKGHGDPAPPPQTGIALNFRSMSVVAKRSSVSSIKVPQTATAEHLSVLHTGTESILGELGPYMLPQ